MCFRQFKMHVLWYASHSLIQYSHQEMENKLNRIEKYLERVRGMVSEHGWMVQTVMSNPPYAYTVGLSADDAYPEIVTMGLDPDTSQGVLNGLARKLLDGQIVLEEAKDYNEIFEQFPARFRKLSSEDSLVFLKVAQAFNNRNTLQAWQLLWPDPQGKFPGEDGVNENYVAMQNLAFTRV